MSGINCMIVLRYTYYRTSRSELSENIQQYMEWKSCNELMWESVKNVRSLEATIRVDTLNVQFFINEYDKCSCYVTSSETFCLELSLLYFNI